MKQSFATGDPRAKREGSEGLLRSTFLKLFSVFPLPAYRPLGSTHRRITMSPNLLWSLEAFTCSSSQRKS